MGLYHRCNDFGARRHVRRSYQTLSNCFRADPLARNGAPAVHRDRPNPAISSRSYIALKWPLTPDEPPLDAIAGREYHEGSDTGKIGVTYLRHVDG
jgi:hypothetical protein